MTTQWSRKVCIEEFSTKFARGNWRERGEAFLPHPPPDFAKTFVCLVLAPRARSCVREARCLARRVKFPTPSLAQPHRRRLSAIFAFEMPVLALVQNDQPSEVDCVCVNQVRAIRLWRRKGSGLGASDIVIASCFGRNSDVTKCRRCCGHPNDIGNSACAEPVTGSGPAIIRVNSNDRGASLSFFRDFEH